jgi:hypothetical protein
MKAADFRLTVVEEKSFPSKMRGALLYNKAAGAAFDLHRRKSTSI